MAHSSAGPSARSQAPSRTSSRTLRRVSDVRIAMWSGPRNISTALMRSWGNRADTVVVDEPLYAHYLPRPGSTTPGRDEIIASQRPTGGPSSHALTGPVPGGAPIFVPEAHDPPPAARDRPRLAGGADARVPDPRPARDARRPTPRSAASRPWRTSGCPQQVELCPQRRSAAPVVDARDILARPARACCASLCAALGIAVRRGDALVARRAPADGRRLGDALVRRRRDVDRLRAVRRRSDEPRPDHLTACSTRCRPYYDELPPHRLRPLSRG